jgi:hypothetical protein
MMRKTEKELEIKRWKKGGSKAGKWDGMRIKNCPFDAKKVCPVTMLKPLGERRKVF